MSTATLVGRALQERLDSARQRTDSIFSLLRPEALYSRPIPERHRLIFYLGHLEAFDWNLICRKTLDVPSFHPQFDTLFEFGIDPPVGQAAQDQPSDWPLVEGDTGLQPARPRRVSTSYWIRRPNRSFRSRWNIG